MFQEYRRARINRRCVGSAVQRDVADKKSRSATRVRHRHSLLIQPDITHTHILEIPTMSLRSVRRISSDGNKIDAKASAFPIWDVVTQMSPIHRYGLAVRKDTNIFPNHLHQYCKLSASSYERAFGRRQSLPLRLGMKAIRDVPIPQESPASFAQLEPGREACQYYYHRIQLTCSPPYQPRRGTMSSPSSLQLLQTFD